MTNAAMPIHRVAVVPVPAGRTPWVVVVVVLVVVAVSLMVAVARSSFSLVILVRPGR